MDLDETPSCRKKGIAVYSLGKASETARGKNCALFDGLILDMSLRKWHNLD
jgi:hypothetical protein